jgi:hypothetical protein
MEALPESYVELEVFNPETDEPLFPKAITKRDIAYIDIYIDNLKKCSTIPGNQKSIKGIEFFFGMHKHEIQEEDLSFTPEESALFQQASKTPSTSFSPLLPKLDGIHKHIQDQGLHFSSIRTTLDDYQPIMAESFIAKLLTNLFHEHRTVFPPKLMSKVDESNQQKENEYWVLDEEYENYCKTNGVPINKNSRTEFNKARRKMSKPELNESYKPVPPVNYHPFTSAKNVINFLSKCNSKFIKGKFIRSQEPLIVYCNRILQESASESELNDVGHLLFYLPSSIDKSIVFACIVEQWIYSGDVTSLSQSNIVSNILLYNDRKADNIKSSNIRNLCHLLPTKWEEEDSVQGEGSGKSKKKITNKTSFITCLNNKTYTFVDLYRGDPVNITLKNSQLPLKDTSADNRVTSFKINNCHNTTNQEHINPVFAAYVGLQSYVIQTADNLTMISEKANSDVNDHKYEHPSGKLKYVIDDFHSRGKKDPNFIKRLQILYLKLKRMESDALELKIADGINPEISNKINLISDAKLAIEYVILAAIKGKTTFGMSRKSIKQSPILLQQHELRELTNLGFEKFKEEQQEQKKRDHSETSGQLKKVMFGLISSIIDDNDDFKYMKQLQLQMKLELQPGTPTTINRSTIDTPKFKAIYTKYLSDTYIGFNESYTLENLILDLADVQKINLNMLYRLFTVILQVFMTKFYKIIPSFIECIELLILMETKSYSEGEQGSVSRSEVPNVKINFDTVPSEQIKEMFNNSSVSTNTYLQYINYVVKEINPLIKVTPPNDTNISTENVVDLGYNLQNPMIDGLSGVSVLERGRMCDDTSNLVTNLYNEIEGIDDETKIFADKTCNANSKDSAFARHIKEEINKHQKFIKLEAEKSEKEFEERKTKLEETLKQFMVELEQIESTSEEKDHLQETIQMTTQELEKLTTDHIALQEENALLTKAEESKNIPVPLIPSRVPVFNAEIAAALGKTKTDVNNLLMENDMLDLYIYVKDLLFYILELHNYVRIVPVETDIIQNFLDTINKLFYTCKIIFVQSIISSKEVKIFDQLIKWISYIEVVSDLFDRIIGDMPRSGSLLYVGQVTINGIIKSNVKLLIGIIASYTKTKSKSIVIDIEQNTRALTQLQMFTGKGTETVISPMVLIDEFPVLTPLHLDRIHGEIENQRRIHFELDRQHRGAERGGNSGHFKNKIIKGGATIQEICASVPTLLKDNKTLELYNIYMEHFNKYSDVEINKCMYSVYSYLIQECDIYVPLYRSEYEDLNLSDLIYESKIKRKYYENKYDFDTQYGHGLCVKVFGVTLYQMMNELMDGKLILPRMYPYLLKDTLDPYTFLVIYNIIKCLCLEFRSCVLLQYYFMCLNIFIDESYTNLYVESNILNEHLLTKINSIPTFFKTFIHLQYNGISVDQYIKNVIPSPALSPAPSPSLTPSLTPSPAPSLITPSKTIPKQRQLPSDLPLEPYMAYPLERPTWVMGGTKRKKQKSRRKGTKRNKQYNKKTKKYKF